MTHSNFTAMRLLGALDTLGSFSRTMVLVLWVTLTSSFCDDNISCLINSAGMRFGLSIFRLHFPRLTNRKKEKSKI